MASSDYGPEGFAGWLNESVDSSIPSLIASPPVSPPWPSIRLAKNSSTPLSTTSPSTPMHIHLRGCMCNGCNLFSPENREDRESFSYPVDLDRVVSRLQAYVDSAVLLVDIGRIHWHAELEEELLISEYQYSTSEAFIEDEVTFWNESGGTIGLDDIISSIEREEQDLINWYWKSIAHKDTTAMVRINVDRFNQDQWERRQLESVPHPAELGVAVLNTLTLEHGGPRIDSDLGTEVSKEAKGQDLLDYKQDKPP